MCVLAWTDDHILWSVFLIRVIAMKLTKVLTSPFYSIFLYIYVLACCFVVLHAGNIMQTLGRRVVPWLAR